MKTQLFGRDFIAEQDWTKEELETALNVAVDLKRKFLLNESTPYLLHKTLFLLFFFSSTRTRTSFEAAMDHLGGNAHDLPSDKLQISHGDTAKEIGKILSSYGHGIAIRHCDWKEGNAYIREVAEHSAVPVYNMQCDIHHPFQAMADLLTIFEKKKTLKKRKIVMSWAYASSYTKPISVPQSFLLLLTKFAADITLAYPKEFELLPEVMKSAKNNIKQNGGSIEITHNMKDAFADADVVYPKSWGPLVITSDPKKCTKIAAKYTDWICDEKIMKLAKRDAIYMHCLPADRGIEVTDEVIDGHQSVVYDQAENRLHVQKAIMALTMGGR
ncbi:ornithine carbamoyltransferase [Candidatus Roizmanbacteria bacterium RIFCSPHIGHO2_01_FULL_39_12c]|uniref:Ornithine carbamoyltransferase n=1 Tax=Candidatus Roizmanbacteria bacterium RIFCSPHIGHO2_01_FULL_39_12c TaxID=1802031 RepID=A0A1F7GAX4_9BACT|nr:MAG: ornithine carbamoyltransferase [Candidatus Roizmanbacteria bacterium RIFCSPHIGHO2_01_FULL_39_12c]OGK46901.1 MAG: ornithine carbamoyltransferase [Candidatus Roizmanbacteria bacterium RIFCSPLOWO2_01_FULL_40_13]